MKNTLRVEQHFYLQGVAFQAMIFYFFQEAPFMGTLTRIRVPSPFLELTSI